MRKGGNRSKVRDKLARLRRDIDGLEGDLQTKAEGMVELISEIIQESHPFDDEGWSDKGLQDAAYAAITEAVGEKTFASLVTVGWHGVTRETVEEELANAVVARSTLRRDLVFILSAVDKCARDGMTAEGWFKGEDGPTYEAMRSLRDNMVRHGWHGCTEETFESIFDAAIAERLGLAGVDVVLHEELDKLPPAQREESFSRFQKRLETEYAQIVSRKGYVSPSVALAATVLSRRDEKIMSDKTGVYLEDGPVEDREKGTGRYAIGEDALYNRHTGGDTAPGWFEREMMKWGGHVWKDTYGIGLGLATARDEAQRLAESLAGDLSHAVQLAHLFNFSAAWAVHAFQRMTTTHTFAAALMCSDADAEVLAGLEKQWKAFVVLVPNGMLPVDSNREISRILVATFEDCAEIHLVQLSQPAGAYRTSMERAPTLAELLTQETPSEIAVDAGIIPPSDRIFTMAKRLVAGLLLSLQDKENFREKIVAAKYSKGRKGPDEPAHRVVHVGKALTVDCRDAVKAYLEGTGKKRQGHHVAPTVATLVRGHYRRQVVGIGRLFRKTIWIQPFWRNVIEGAPILTRPRGVQ
jgi:hypothetical protein